MTADHRATALRVDACASCLRRTALVAALSGRIEQEWRLRRGRPQLLALSDADLVDWGGESQAAAVYERFNADAAVDRLLAGGTSALCRCSADYPHGLAELPDPPAVLHVRGDASLLARPGVALVGARRASSVGLEVARSLARGLAVAGVPVVSGMALGVDGAAHTGALDAGGQTVAVLATGVDRPYPARHTNLHGRIVASGCVVSELPPGTEPRRWAFPARNRVIAAVAAVTVVVEGGERSGSLITADFAADLGRTVCAVPGAVTSSLAAGPNALLKLGAEVVRSTDDVLDLLAAVPDPAPAAARSTDGARRDGPPLAAWSPGAASGRSIAPPAYTTGPMPPLRAPGGLTGRLILGEGPRTTAAPAAVPVPPDLDPRTHEVLERIEAGEDSLAALMAGADDAFAISSDLGELEVRGLVRRLPSGHYIRALR